MSWELSNMSKKSNKAKTFPVPKNEYGIFAMHTDDNKPISVKDQEKFFKEVMPGLSKRIEEEIQKPLIIKDNI
jgi:hypothetical protein